VAAVTEGRKAGQSLALSTESSEGCPIADPFAEAASPATTDSSTKSASVTAAAA